MRTSHIFFVAVLAITIVAMQSCKNKAAKNDKENQNNTVEVADYDYQGDKLVVTDKIMYDVPIVNEIIGDRTKKQS